MSETHNCHTHIFNIENAPKRFLQGFTAKIVANIAWPVLNTRFGAYVLIKLIKTFARDPHTKKLAGFLKVGTMKSQNDIFSELKNNYSSGDKFVVLTLNMDHMGAGKAKYNFNTQVHEIKRIKAQNIETCLPFYSVDPRAGAALQIKEKTEDRIINKGFVGIKIYPALGYYPFDRNLEEVYKWASEKSIPIMTHCNRVGSYYLGKISQDMINPDSFYNGPLDKWPENFGKLEFPITHDLDNNSEFCDNFSEIYNYARVLHRFDKLKICFAHAGGVKEIILHRGKDPDKAWFNQIKHLMRVFPNVYTDVSYTLYKKKVFPHLLELLQDSEIGHKVIFGTDYFMTLQEDTETKLISRFRNYLEENSSGENLWKKLAIDNPKAYLTSDYYEA